MAQPIHDDIGDCFHARPRLALGLPIDGASKTGDRIVQGLFADRINRLFAMAAANRDPAVFEYPDRFEPGRDSGNKLLSFGPGPRLCPGMHLARRQLAVALDVLMERLPQLRLRDVDAAQPRGAILRGPERLPAAW